MSWLLSERTPLQVHFCCWFHALVSWSDSLAVHCEDCCHCTHSVCQYLVGLLSHTDTAAGGGIVDEFESQWSVTINAVSEECTLSGTNVTKVHVSNVGMLYNSPYLLHFKFMMCSFAQSHTQLDVLWYYHHSMTHCWSLNINLSWIS